MPPAPPSGARQIWRRLRGRPAALTGGVVIVLLVLIAAGAPLLAAIEGQDTTSYHPGLVDSASGGVPLGHFGGISGSHWLGVEPGTGRDLFARLVYGARVSLGVAIGATILQVLIGVAFGLAAGLGSRWVDSLLSRVTDVFVVMPALILAIALLAVVPGSFPRPVLLTLVLGFLAWGGFAKIVRAQVLTQKSLDYVAASRLAGSSPWRTARRELLPALVAPVLTYAAITLPTNIVSEAGLSFLGIGVTPPTPSWGQMLSSATTWYQADSSYVLLPAVLLFVTVLAFTVFADGIRTALDPRAASRLRVGTRAGRRGAGTADSAATPADAASGIPGPADPRGGGAA
ncbi:ABC transporter permease [Actinacidiphila acidipaludis]|uniref:ABC transporter permease n=1 Tax=Actinacidiphila acidipaludis TaxID=2873382 RepID=A0ABS7Q1G5_9ACTN|nr:ABC transporter permease [Streptomyces acidipaludis]MBY8876980.1 ABC transporter permease [Streptomyces acidipaludis]